jgi:hypothetical protein
MKRVIIWTVSFALLGGLLGAKGAWFELKPVLVGVTGGALLGFCIGFLIHKHQ